MSAAAMRTLLVAACLAACAPVCIAGEAARQRAEEIVRRSFSSATDEEWATRMRQDDAQAMCSLYQNSLPSGLVRRITMNQLKSMRYPASGQLHGDWKSGERIASTPGGGQTGTIQPDPPGTVKGGNCYACHALDPKELAAGTVGPSLTGYGKARGQAADVVKRTYEKIYNAQASMPCSLMPRFGHNGWLTPEQVADLTAYLLDPDSPVNR